MEIAYNEAEIRQLKREYEKQWRAKNKDKVRAKNRRYWQKKLATLSASEQSNGGNNDERKGNQ